MAVFDRENAKIVVRVVYDGPGNAGKTTNLAQMCEFFTSRRRSELYSPEVRDGRTMWFDWMQIEAGVVAGHGLRCQIVTVPGQVALRRRRSVLLRAADVVVLVCDSTRTGLELVRPAFGRIRQFIDEQVGSDVPIVVQANKQDLPGALGPDQIAAALGADESIPIIGACANAGIGVKETLVLAIRAAANRAQQLVLDRGVEAMTGEPDDASKVLEELKRLDDGDEAQLDEMLARPGFVEDLRTGRRSSPLPVVAEASEPVAAASALEPSPMLATALEAAKSAAVAVEIAQAAVVSTENATTEPLPVEPAAPIAASEPVEAAPPVATSEPVEAAPRVVVSALDPEPVPPVAIREPVPRVAVSALDPEPAPAHQAPAIAASHAPAAVPLPVAAEASKPSVAAAEAPARRRPTGPVASTVPLHHESRPGDTQPLAIVRPRLPAPVAATVPIPTTPPIWWPTPPQGDSAIAPGNLWPAATGREILRRLATSTPRPRIDLVAQHGFRDGSGKASAVIYDSDGWCLKTSSTRRFEDLDAARSALVKLARIKIALGSLTLPNTVLVTAGDPSDGYWVWTFAPWRQTLRGAMTEAVATGDRAALGDALVQFADAVTEALLRALRAGQGLDLHPSNFARDQGVLVYLDDEVFAAPPVPGAAHAILQRAEELSAYPGEVERYAMSLIEQLSGRLSAVDLTRLRLVDELRTTSPRAPTARALRARLLAALSPPPAVSDTAVWTAVAPPLPPPGEAAQRAAFATASAAPTSPVPVTMARALGSGISGVPGVSAAPGTSDAGWTLSAPDAAARPAPAHSASTSRTAIPLPALPPLAAAVPAPARAPSATPAPPTPVEPDPPAAASATGTIPPSLSAAATAETWPAPPVAAEHLPSGFIWPVVAGRELVRQVFSHTPTRRDERPFTYEVGDYLLSTSSERRFHEVDDARAELLRLARAQVARGNAREALVLVLAPDDTQGGHWIWTIAPIADDACASP